MTTSEPTTGEIIEDLRDKAIRLEERLSSLLCYVTGGLLSKTNYSADTMISAADDYQQRMCNECRKEQAEQDGGGK